jgi:hypothetical protein
MSPGLQVRRSARSRLAFLLALLLVGLPPGECAGAAGADAKQKCQQQLKLLAEAIGKYRQDHDGLFPAKLGDLYSTYISEESRLQCPAARVDGAAGTANPHVIVPGPVDVKVLGYTWELSREDPPDWDRKSAGMSFAQFKDFQRRSLVSNSVPIVRCSHHGNDTYLNLTEDGTIYESGLYWECNFVDQLSGIRLAPRLVEQADRPISALIRPRPAGATDVMLDLRPWCNARFDDPWVNGDPEKEQIQHDRELGGGVITNQGIAFDVAGIIQLNGKLNPRDEWHGFDRLMYPRAVKSITIKRAFRVMHVLGTVQFEDPPGTAVGTVEIHRTGSSPEKWSWRYGVDVLNYRFVPGASEPRLESTVVAWTGSFVDPEVQKKQKPRLFHLRFLTAEPKVVVDHLDFLVGDGVSSPLIAAITLE